MSITRYDFTSRYDNILEPVPEGSYVLYDDHVKAIFDAAKATNLKCMDAAKDNAEAQLYFRYGLFKSVLCSFFHIPYHETMIKIGGRMDFCHKCKRVWNVVRLG